jgi:hypothetical protein
MLASSMPVETASAGKVFTAHKAFVRQTTPFTLAVPPGVSEPIDSKAYNAGSMAAPVPVPDRDNLNWD